MISGNTKFITKNGKSISIRDLKIGDKIKDANQRTATITEIENLGTFTNNIILTFKRYSKIINIMGNEDSKIYVSDGSTETVMTFGEIAEQIDKNLTSLFIFNDDITSFEIIGCKDSITPTEFYHVNAKTKIISFVLGETEDPDIFFIIYL